MVACCAQTRCGREERRARDHGPQAKSCNHAEEFELNPKGDGELLKCLQEGSGSSGSVDKGSKDRVPQRTRDLARALLGKVGRESTCSGPRAPASGGPGCTSCLLPVQQQDDLGAAFQTWMDTNGALRAEVWPGALPTWEPFQGDTEIMT